jgi:hypothetical protein
LAWSGNLWVWAPQLRWEHRITLAEDRQAGFEFGLYDPSYGFHYSDAAYGAVSPGEAARQPGYEMRLSYRAGKDSRALQLGAAGYYDRKNYGSGQTVDAWAGATDWRLPVAGHGQWSGEFYRGRGIATHTRTSTRELARQISVDWIPSADGRKVNGDSRRPCS